MPLRDPTLIIRLTPTRHRGTIRPSHAHLIGRIHFFRSCSRFPRARGVFPAAFLGLREEGCDPGVVDEVDGAGEEGEEEEVEEDAVFVFCASVIVSAMRGGIGWQGKVEDIYIWGSKILVSGSTTATVSLKAGSVYGVPSLSVTTTARFSTRSCGCSSVANLYSTLSFSPAGIETS